ncbi:J domain-containing protein [Algicola sagamiensis]|uniref:J domain-containing protein n=1 Tax=Algicola sagamiensis TaxID=163869 RepID=UPI0003621003|nr:J domain-containing protein [Algicola sagamiensis]
MSYQNPWEFLEITSAATEREVKRAYAKKLKQHRPDQDPEGFKQLREAYEFALNHAKNWCQQPPEVHEAEETNSLISASVVDDDEGGSEETPPQSEPLAPIQRKERVAQAFQDASHPQEEQPRAKQRQAPSFAEPQPEEEDHQEEVILHHSLHEFFENPDLKPLIQRIEWMFRSVQSVNDRFLWRDFQQTIDRDFSTQKQQASIITFELLLSYLNHEKQIRRGDAEKVIIKRPVLESIVKYFEWWQDNQLQLYFSHQEIQEVLTLSGVKEILKASEPHWQQDNHNGHDNKARLKALLEEVADTEIAKEVKLLIYNRNLAIYGVRHWKKLVERILRGPIQDKQIASIVMLVYLTDYQRKQFQDDARDRALASYSVFEYLDNIFGWQQDKLLKSYYSDADFAEVMGIIERTKTFEEKGEYGKPGLLSITTTFLIDGFIAWWIYLFFEFSLMSIGFEKTNGYWLFALSFWLYHTSCELSPLSRTYGKRFSRQILVSHNGKPVTLKAKLIKSAITFSFVIAFWFITLPGWLPFILGIVICWHIDWAVKRFAKLEMQALHKL